MDKVSQRRQELERQLRRLRTPQSQAGAEGPSLPAQADARDFHELFDKHSAIMFLVDGFSLRIIDANQAASDFYGYSRKEFLDMRVVDLNTLSEEEIRQRLRQAESAKNYLFRFKHRLKNRELREVEVRSTPIGLSGGRQVFFAIVHDITERTRREEELRQSEERYRLLVENARELVVVIQDGVFRYVNPRAEALTGFTSQELLGQQFLDFVAPEDRESVRQRYLARMEGQVLCEVFLCRVLNRDGHPRWLEMSGAVIEWEGRPAALALLSDVGQRRQAEEERVLRERLRAAIATAGAACHELNQPLQALLFQLELLTLKLPPSHPQSQAVAVALEQAAKLADITQRLNRLTDYRTRQYLSRQHILDLENSSSVPPVAGEAPKQD